VIPDHHGDEDGEGEAEVHNGGTDRCEGDGETGEVDLGNEAFAADDGVTGRCDGGGEEGPGENAGVDEEFVGQATGVLVEAGHFAEEDSEDDGGHDGLEDGPGCAEKGLLVADFDIAPDEEEEKFAVVPELGGVDELPAAGGFDEGAMEGREFRVLSFYFGALSRVGLGNFSGLGGGRREGGDFRGCGRSGDGGVSGNGSPGSDLRRETMTWKRGEFQWDCAWRG